METGAACSGKMEIHLPLALTPKGLSLWYFHYSCPFLIYQQTIFSPGNYLDFDASAERQSRRNLRLQHGLFPAQESEESPPGWTNITLLDTDSCQSKANLLLQTG